MKEIELRNHPGKVALVDDNDYDWLLNDGPLDLFGNAQQMSLLRCA
jgi:hypothetical protein